LADAGGPALPQAGAKGDTKMHEKLLEKTREQKSHLSTQVGKVSHTQG
jgi:hypothetical protein